MAERETSIVVKPEDMRCSNCRFANQIVANIGGGITEDGEVIASFKLQTQFPVGQVRNCYGWLEKFILEEFSSGLHRFIYPGDDDSCIRLSKFRPKGTSDKK